MTRHNFNVYRGHVHNHILHAEHGVGGLRLAQLGTRAVTDLRDRLRAAGVTVPTTRKVLATLHGPLRGGYMGHDNMVKRKFAPLFDKLAELYRDDPTEHPPAPDRFNWHALRHFAVSCWIDAGLNPKTVQTFAGHGSLQVTMDRYGHMFKSEDHKRAMDAIAMDMFN